jgi:hypothetical protein
LPQEKLAWLQVHAIPHVPISYVVLLLAILSESTVVVTQCGVLCLSRPMYSDALFQPFFCSAMRINPKWLAVDNITRVSDLSLQDFIEKFEAPNLPVLFTDVASKWPACKKWSLQYFVEHHGSKLFRCGAVDIRVDDFVTYLNSCKDDRPLYMFDCRFGEKCPDLASDYSVPEYFSEDLFGVLGASRPDYRWVIGTCFVLSLTEVVCRKWFVFFRCSWCGEIWIHVSHRPQ